jgi:hypothetical protein
MGESLVIPLRVGTNQQARMWLGRAAQGHTIQNQAHRAVEQSGSYGATGS